MCLVRVVLGRTDTVGSVATIFVVAANSVALVASPVIDSLLGRAPASTLGAGESRNRLYHRNRNVWKMTRAARKRRRRCISYA